LDRPWREAVDADLRSCSHRNTREPAIPAEVTISAPGSGFHSGSPLDQRGFDAFDGILLIDPLDGSDFARHAGERGLIKLPLTVGLLRLTPGAMQIANNFRDRDQVPGIDLCFIFLGPAAPHSALDSGPTFERVEG